MYVILNWNEYSQINVSSDASGETKGFDSKDEALIWADENEAFNWKVVEV